MAARRFSGRVTAVNVAVNPASRTVLVEATFANDDLRLKPGMFATAEIEQGSAREVVALPRAAVQKDDRTDGFRAWVVEGGRARIRIVQMVREVGDRVLIAAGVRAGEPVITSDAQGLFDGAPVITQ
jgi:membrane fusion protein, multidrug efflux system